MDDSKSTSEAKERMNPLLRRVDNAEVRWYDGYGGQWPTEKLANEAGEMNRAREAEEAAESRNAEIRAANAARNAGAHARDEYMASEQLNAEIVAAGLDKPDKSDADLVQDAIEMHGKLGVILEHVTPAWVGNIYNKQKVNQAYGALALALADLRDEVK